MGVEHFKRKIEDSALGDNTIKVLSVSLTKTEVGALRATPKTLVPAPGVGKVARLIGIVILHNYLTPAWTESTANLAVKYKDGSGVQASQTIEMTGFIDQAANMMTSGEPKIDVIATKAQAENQPLVLHNLGAAEFGGSGNSTMTVKVAYRIHNSGW